MKTPSARQSYLLVCMSLIFPVQVLAGDDEALAELMALLSQETDLATKTNMNADYVPGSVTVMHGDKLKEMGVQTTGEALQRVPGIYVSVGNTGQVVSVVRGVGSSLSSSNLKIMLNGVSINSAVTGAADSVLRLPIFQVDRIEVIRGPGSSIYGEFAFSGVVNIITRENNQAIHMKGGSNGYGQIDVALAGESGGGVGWGMNVSFWNTDGTARESGVDNFSFHGAGYAPSDIFDQEQGLLLSFKAAYSGYQLRGQYIEVERGSFFGRVAKSEDDYSPRKEELFNVSLVKKWKLSDTLDSVFTTTYQHINTDEAEQLVLPAGIPLPGTRPPLINPEDNIEERGQEESYLKVSALFDWQTSVNNQLMLILEAARFEVSDAYKSLVGADSGMVFEDEKPEALIDSDRRYNSAVLQDQWKVFDGVELTFGVRHDDYSDIGSRSSPRVAGVWRVAENHIVKLQYAEAYRPPTLEQRYFGINSSSAEQANDLSPEELASAEVSYIYRQAYRKITTTLFRAEYTDLIELLLIPGQVPTYHNVGEVNAMGAEWEWVEQINDSWQVLSNISYVETEDKLDTDEEFTGVVNWLANLGVFWEMTPHTSHSLLLHYVGEQEGAELPNLALPHVETFDAYTTVDYTLTYKPPMGGKDLLVQFVIKNLTDEEWEIQSYPTQWPEGLTQGGISGYLGIEYGF
ncbi:hypothetical protein A9Q99_05170 [Gammaproteobacteria bacterium 45_16_T64]|nr:hypothetical protein A9Q99_05170 [Gammaproteobacteria bacterium 45_16_T64]